MADGSSDLERSEDPTPRRRQDARDEGRIPRSAELTTAAVLLGSALVLGALTPGVGRRMLGIFGTGLGATGINLDGATSVGLVRMMAAQTFFAIAPLLAAIAGIALVVSAGQARGMLSTTPLAPKWERVSPAANARRMFGAQPWAELAKSLLKLLIVGLAVRSALRSAWGDIIALGDMSPVALLDVVRRYGLRVLLTAGIAYIALAVLDYIYQLWQHEKSLKMTKEEVKQEMKQSEGDPMVKQRIRSFGRSLARRQMFRDVPRADLVIANPTHIAIALLYDPDKAPAPIVLAMGQRKVAERIKKIAFEHGVPVIENKPLARALLAVARVGVMIPAELYAAVAEVLAFVLKQRAMAPSRWRGARA